MTRLDSAIARMQAQRVLLGFAAEQLGGREGAVLEVGLGNGRTYDHIRWLMPERTIHVFDRRISPHPDAVPPEELAWVGEMTETLPRAAAELGPVAILAHADIGGGGQAASDRNAAAIGPLLPPLLLTGALVLCDQELRVPDLEPLPLPDGVPRGRYFMYGRV